MFRGEDQVDLTPTEFNLLRFFKLGIVRDGATDTVTATLGTRPETVEG